MGLLDLRRQSDSSHPYKVCLIVGNGGNGAFSDFCLTPIRRAGLALLSI
jgi:hypothetical protein